MSESFCCVYIFNNVIDNRDRIKPIEAYLFGQPFTRVCVQYFCICNSECILICSDSIPFERPSPTYWNSFTLSYDSKNTPFSHFIFEPTGVDKYLDHLHLDTLFKEWLLIQLYESQTCVSM